MFGFGVPSRSSSSMLRLCFFLAFFGSDSPPPFSTPPFSNTVYDSGIWEGRGAEWIYWGGERINSAQYFRRARQGGGVERL